MIKALKKKNSEYSTKERWFTSVVTFLVFAVFSYWLLRNSEMFQSQNLFPGLGALVIGLVTAFIGYKFPKIMHLTVFALPLMFLGS